MLRLYSKRNCHLCDVAKKELQAIEGLQFQEIDIYENDELLEKYGLMVPVVVLGEVIIQYGQVRKSEVINFLKSETKQNVTNDG